MNNITVIEDILNISCEEKIKITNYFNIWGKKLIFEIESQSNSVVCPCCSRRTSKRQDYVLYRQKTTLKHIVLSDNRIIELCPKRRYFRCSHCKDQFFEKFSFESKKWYHTIAFESYILASWWYLSWSEVWRLCWISSSKVYMITQHIDVWKLNERGLKIMEELDEINLWIDEHAFRWKDMILIITELKKKEVLAILHWITNEILESWINSLSPEIQTKIVWFSTDMNKWYRWVIERLLKHPLHVVDKYHLVQEANRMITAVLDVNIWAMKMWFLQEKDLIQFWKIPRSLSKEQKEKLKRQSLIPMKKYKDKVDQRLQTKDIHPKLLRNNKWEKICYREITLEYFLEKKYLSLFRTREKNLFPLQKLRLNQILSEFDYKNYLKESWLIKESFCDALDERDIETINTIIDDCRKSEHYRIQQFWRTLSNWYRWIANYCKLSTEEFRFTNAYTECINNQCKLAKRQSYWFRYKENYSRKLYAKFSR